MRDRDKNKPLPFFSLLFKWLSKPLVLLLVVCVVMLAIYGAAALVVINREAGKLTDEVFIVPPNKDVVINPED